MCSRDQIPAEQPANEERRIVVLPAGRDRHGEAGSPEVADEVGGKLRAWPVLGEQQHPLRKSCDWAGQSGVRGRLTAGEAVLSPPCLGPDQRLRQMKEG